MDLWPSKVIVLLLCCCGGSAIDEGKPYFISRNFNTVLHWKRADSHGEEVLYSVQYTRYGEEYKPKLECQNITALLCDLTTETPYIYARSYYARVFANAKILGQTVNFLPLRETVLGPPTVTVTPTTSSIKATITLPLGPDNRTSIEEIFNSTSFFYNTPPTRYTLAITHPSWAAQVHETTTGEFVVNHLRNNNTEYCGYVYYKPTKELNRPASEKQVFCVTLPGDSWLLLPWFLLFGCLLLCSLLPALVVCYQYVRKASNMPETLNLSKNAPRSWLIPEAISISITKPDPARSSYDVESKASGPYFHPNGQPWPSDSYMGQQGPAPDHYNDSTRSSTNYSMVVVGVTKEVEQDRRQGSEVNPLWSDIPSDRWPRWAEGGPDRCARGPLPVLDPGLRDSDVLPIVLPTRRYADGRLTISTMLPQQEPKRATGPLANAEGQPLLPGPPGGPGGTQQGAPLLSDVVTVDERSNSDAGTEDGVTAYRPNVLLHSFKPRMILPPTMLTDCESSLITPTCAYKQCWVDRASPSGLSPQDSFEMSTYAPQRTWPRQRQDGDTLGEEGSGCDFLGGWMVQIQG